MTTRSTIARLDVNTGGLPWFALRVRSGREPRVADHLASKGYELFLPLYSCHRRWSDRMKKVDLPLFPGYLFCRFNPYNRLPILKTPWLLQIVGFTNNPSPVKDEEIRSIRTIVASGATVEPFPFLNIGEKVRIESGPLAGLVGIVAQFKGKQKLVLSISLLQRSVAVEIDSTRVTPSERAVQRVAANELSASA
jgi:transcription antitermination factor NusG